MAEEVAKAEAELKAIKKVVEAVAALDQNSKRRVLGYAASLFDVNEVRQPMRAAPPPPVTGQTRRIPLPPGTDPRAVAAGLVAAGVDATARS